MSITTYLIVFGSGLIAGMIIIFIAMKVNSGEHIDITGMFGKLFSLLPFRRSSEEKPELEETAAPPLAVDPREQDLYDSAQIIRKILLTLGTNIQLTDKAASDSSLALGDVKNAVNSMGLPTNLGEAQSLLMKEIDHVISSNTSLKGKLARSQAVLTEQQSQIEHLRTAVRIDGLTQVANRTYFDEKLGEMIKLRQRYDDPFSLMVIDLDNFKGINDGFGHPAGDRILKGVAKKMKVTLRGSDFIARIGGDEYAVILIKSDISVATEVAWKLCEEVRASRFLLDNTKLSITLSIGVAEASAHDTEVTLLKRADEALYRAKGNGRNCVAVA